MSSAASAPQSPEFVRAFERGIAVITAFTGHSLTLSEVAATTNMSPAAARRYLATLVEMGYLTQSGSRFSAHVRLVELSAPYFLAQSGMHKAKRAVEQLAREINETATITQLDGTDVINVFAVETMHDLAIKIQPGRRLPAFCTAMGRATLALLSEAESDDILEQSTLRAYTPATITDRGALRDIIGRVREQGYAYIREEYQSGIQTASVGFRLSSGAYCAISAPTPLARESEEAYLERVLQPLYDGAERARG